MEVQRYNAHDERALAFLAQNSHSFFTTLKWFRVLEDGFKAPVNLYCLEDQGVIHSVLPGVVFDLGIIRMFYSSIPYGGFEGPADPDSKALALFEKAIRKDSIHVIRIGRTITGDVPTMAGFQRREAFTHLVHLEDTDEERIWKGYKQRVRRDVRKAEKSGLYVEELISPDQIEAIYRLYYQTMRRNQAYITWTRDALYGIYEHLVKEGRAKIILAKKDDEIAAAIILLLSRDTVYYFFSASSEKHFQYCPNDLLVHHSICLALREGRKFFDLMTSRKDDEALMHFKEKWGAEKLPFLFFEKKLAKVRPLLWDQLWKAANTRLGASLLRVLKR